jgi:hypothetical protein
MLKRLVASETLAATLALVAAAEIATTLAAFDYLPLVRIAERTPQTVGIWGRAWIWHHPPAFHGEASFGHFPYFAL